MRHLVIGQRQKAPISNFSAFHWSPHSCLITISQHFLTTRVENLPKRTKTSLITESDQSRANHQLLQLCTVRTAWFESDQAVRAGHSCKSCLKTRRYTKVYRKIYFVELLLVLGCMYIAVYQQANISVWVLSVSYTCHNNVDFGV